MSKITIGKETLSLLTGSKTVGANASVLLVVAKAATNGKELPAWAREVPDAHWRKTFNLAPEVLKNKVLVDDSYALLRTVINAHLDKKWASKHAVHLETLVKIDSFSKLSILAKLKGRKTDDVVPTPTKLDKAVAHLAELTPADQLAAVKAACDLTAFSWSDDAAVAASKDARALTTLAETRGKRLAELEKENAHLSLLLKEAHQNLLAAELANVPTEDQATKKMA